jgi:D-tyrosyl-tRNA(Tyr) deacylase
MLTVVQRVKQGKVIIAGKTYSQIGSGYVILLGILEEDDKKDIERLVEKIINLRILNDSVGKMNKSIIETKGEILVVSQFTLAADLTGGRRPSFIKAMMPEEAEKLYKLFVKKLKEKGLNIKTGKFGEYMEVQIVNDGPVTIIVDSKKI